MICGANPSSFLCGTKSGLVGVDAEIEVTKSQRHSRYAFLSLRSSSGSDGTKRKDELDTWQRPSLKPWQSPRQSLLVRGCMYACVYVDQSTDMSPEGIVEEMRRCSCGDNKGEK